MRSDGGKNATAGRPAPRRRLNSATLVPAQRARGLLRRQKGALARRGQPNGALAFLSLREPGHSVSINETAD
jgi:hypothetical protein